MMENDISVKWNILQLKCAKCQTDLVIKQTLQGCFYCCDMYPKCFNKMNTVIYESILEKITNCLSLHPNVNFTGYKWKYKTGYQHYDFKVIKHTPSNFIVSVLNVKQYKTPY